jgi:hypothetical protein
VALRKVQVIRGFLKIGKQPSFPDKGKQIARSQAAFTKQYHFGIGESDGSEI